MDYFVSGSTNEIYISGKGGFEELMTILSSINLKDYEIIFCNKMPKFCDCQHLDLEDFQKTGFSEPVFI